MVQLPTEGENGRKFRRPAVGLTLEEKNDSGGASPLTVLQKPNQKQNTAQPGRWEQVRPEARRPSGRKKKEACGLEVRGG